MKKNVLQFFISIFILSIFSCTGDFTTGSDILKPVDFKKYRTYAWLPYVDSITARNINTEQLNSYLFSTIDKQFYTRNMTIDTVKPDILVRFSIAINNSNVLVSSPVYAYQPSVSYGFGYGYGYGYYGSGVYYYNQPVQVATQTQNVKYQNGSLFIDVIDHATNEVVWRGYAYQSQQANMEPAQLSAMHQKVDQIIADIFFNFPIKKIKK